jgi:predicted ATPase/DNA-binding CsgD family transcriptional regulator
VLADVATAVATLLARCPGVSVLATSQVPLRVPGERLWRVPPMNMADALELFLARSRLLGADPGSDVHEAARRVCERLDRLPLALELAAGWAGTLSPDQIAEAVADPLPVLRRGPRFAPLRQQSLEASVRVSHDRLDLDERVLFRRLAAFRPGFTAKAVAEVCGFGELDPTRVLSALRELVDASLLVADTTGGEARYSMLGVIRAYAVARLTDSDDWDATHDRYLDAYLAIIQDLRPLLDSDKDAWRTLVNREYANIRAAIEWGLNRDDTTPGRRLAAGMAWLWHLEGRGSEGIVLLRRAVEAGGQERSVAQARVLLALAVVVDATQPGEEGFAAARAADEMATELSDDETRLVARSLLAIGMLAADLDGARAAAEHVSDEARRLGHVFAAEASDVLVGLVCLMRDEHARAIEILEPATTGLLGRGDRHVASTGMSFLALAHARSGDVERAADVAQLAVAAAEPLRDILRVGWALSTLAEVRRLQGRLDAAAGTLRRIERLVDDSGLAPFIPGWERTEAHLALSRGNAEEAVRWCRREGELFRDGPDDHLGGLTVETKVVLAAALLQVGQGEEAERVLEDAESAARTMGLPGTLATATDLRAQAIAAQDIDGAVAAHHEALRIRSEHGFVLGCIDSLEALAVLAHRRGAREVTGALAGAAQRARAESGYEGRALAADWRAALAPLLEEQEVAAASERGRAMDLREALAYAARARGPRRRPDTGWDSLTPTELSVVELTVQGLSNPEIAGRLFMSRGTVKTHLGHVYGKLGIANRTELARAVHELYAIT